MCDEWKQYNTGKRWRVLADGQYEVEHEGIVRSRGNPTSMILLVREYGERIERAARVARVPREWVAAMITIEASRLRKSPRGKSWQKTQRYLRAGWDRKNERVNGLRFDPVSVRLEPGYVSPQDTPGRISASLAQVLLSTAREQADRAALKLECTVRGETFDLSGSQALIFEPALCLVVSALYMEHLAARYRSGVQGHEFDFVHLTGAYNAGSIKADEASPFGIMAYDTRRTDKALRFYNDLFDPLVQAEW